MILVWAPPSAPRAASLGGRVQLSWLERQQLSRVVIASCAVGSASDKTSSGPAIMIIGHSGNLVSPWTK